MRISHFYFVIILMVLSACSQNDNTVKFKVTNPTDLVLKGATIEVTNPAVLEKLNSPDQYFSIRFGDNDIPYQSMGDKLLVLCDLEPGEEKELELVQTDSPVVFAPKTQAEISIKEGGEWEWLTKSNGNEQYEYKGGTWKNISELEVPEQHTDHSFYIRYEGPGWESDKVGYRFYLDWRNAVDIFGKKTDKLVLQNVGKDNFDSYHEMSDWGVDVLKVGNSLGMGSIGHWADNKANRVAKTDGLYSRVEYSEVLESKVTTIYSGWETLEGKTDLTSELSIRAGSYLTKSVLSLSNSLENICTGIVKHENASVLKSEGSSEWAYLATFGVQTLQDDNLGMAVFYKTEDLIELTEDELSHVAVLKPTENKLTYFFGSVWEHDSSKIKTPEEFEEFLNSQLQLLNNGML